MSTGKQNLKSNLPTLFGGQETRNTHAFFFGLRLFAVRGYSTAARAALSSIME